MVSLVVALGTAVRRLLLIIIQLRPWAAGSLLLPLPVVRSGMGDAGLGLTGRSRPASHRRPRRGCTAARSHCCLGRRPLLSARSGSGRIPGPPRPGRRHLGAGSRRAGSGSHRRARCWCRRPAEEESTYCCSSATTRETMQDLRKRVKMTLACPSSATSIGCPTSATLEPGLCIDCAKAHANNLCTKLSVVIHRVPSQPARRRAVRSAPRRVRQPPQQEATAP